jgi:hypothetical protein
MTATIFVDTNLFVYARDAGAHITTTAGPSPSGCQCQREDDEQCGAQGHDSERTTGDLRDRRRYGLLRHSVHPFARPIITHRAADRPARPCHLLPT